MFWHSRYTRDSRNTTCIGMQWMFGDDGLENRRPTMKTEFHQGYVHNLSKTTGRSTEILRQFFLDYSSSSCCARLCEL